MNEGARYQPVTAVVFDVGRVLIRWDMRLLFSQMIADADELDWFCSHVVTEQWHSQADAGRPLDDMLAERIALYPDHAELITAYRRRFVETIPGHVEGSHALVRRLAKTGMPLFALTNFASEFWRQFRPGEPVFDLFDDIVVSGDEGCAKPGRRIYEIAENRFGHHANGLLFIDDSLENVAAARERGWQGHVFTIAERLEDELVARGLLDRSDTTGASNDPA